MIDDVLRELLRLPGATHSCAVDRATGHVVAEAGAETVDPAAVVRWVRTVADLLADADDALDDLMITSRRSYRLVRPVDGGPHGPLLLQLCLDRSRANLAAARRELALVRFDVPPPVRSPAPLPGPDGLLPLPRRVPASIPPPAGWTPPARAARWPSRARPPSSSAGLAVVPQPRGPAPAPRPDAPAAGAATARWADDVGTLRRLLAGLRALR